MKIKLLAEEKTNQAMLDHLIAGIQEVFPITVEFVGQDRYTLPESNLLPSHPREVGSLTGILGARDPETGDTWYNATPIASHYTVEDGLLLMIIHYSFFYLKEPLYIPKFHMVGPSDGTFIYSGEFFQFERVGVVGAKNEPNDNNVRVAAHELGHETITEYNHCKNYVGTAKCLMNSPSYNSEEAIQELHMGFCDHCTIQIKSYR